MFAKIVTVALLAVGHCQATENWLRGGTTCVGVNMDMPTTMMYGPCATEDNKATTYISQTLVGGGVSNVADNYWSGGAAAYEAIPFSMTGGKPASYAVRAGMGLTISGQDGCEYAAAQAAVTMGSGTSQGVFQYAAMISTGSANCTTSTVEVVIPVSSGCVDDACEMTPPICISGADTGAACAAKSFKPGSVKFSGGFALDNGFSKKTLTTGGLDIEFIGYRLKYDFTSFGTGATWYFNGDTTLKSTNLASTEVASFTVTSKDGSKSLTIKTGGKYTHGTFTSAVFTKTGSTSIKCRSAAVSGSQTAIYVDFLFAAADLGSDKWAIYDPEIVTTGGSTAGSVHVVASTITVALLAAVAAFVGL